MQVLLLSLIITLLVICPNNAQSEETAGVYSVFIEPGSSPQVGGQLIIATAKQGVSITGQITGLTPGQHGFHIHEKGVLTNECKDAGPHFNPFLKSHGHPRDEHRHVGDLGNIEADASGIAKIDILDRLASLDPSSPTFIGNRAIVVHAKSDDVGRGGDEESKKTGNAGARVGCGIIAHKILSQTAQAEIQQPPLQKQTSLRHQPSQHSTIQGSFQQQSLQQPSFQQQTSQGAFQQRPQQQPLFQEPTFQDSFQHQPIRQPTFQDSFQQQSIQQLFQQPNFQELLQQHTLQQPSFQQPTFQEIFQQIPQQQTFQGTSFRETPFQQQTFQGTPFHQDAHQQSSFQQQPSRQPSFQGLFQEPFHQPNFQGSSFQQQAHQQPSFQQPSPQPTSHGSSFLQQAHQQPFPQPTFQGSSFQQQSHHHPIPQPTSQGSSFEQQSHHHHQPFPQPTFQGSSLQQQSHHHQPNPQPIFQESSFQQQSHHHHPIPQPTFQGSSFQQQAHHQPSDAFPFPVDFESNSPTRNTPFSGKIANVRIIPGSSQSVHGNLKIEEVPGGIILKGFISGLTPGLHGFHIHEEGDLGNECKNALGHFNPFKVTHGDPQDPQRHVGDLGNILADSSGVAHIDIYDPLATFDPHEKAFIGDRAIVVHAKQDDLGRGGDAESKKTGNAGARVGCGIIRVNDSIIFPIVERPVRNRQKQSDMPIFFD